MRLVFIHSNIYCQSTRVRLIVGNLKINKTVSGGEDGHICTIILSST